MFLFVHCQVQTAVDNCDALSLPQLLDERKWSAPSPVFQNALQWLLEYKKKVQEVQDELENKLKNMLSSQSCEESRLVVQQDLSALQGKLVSDTAADNPTDNAGGSKRIRSVSPTGADNKKQRSSAPGLRCDQRQDLFDRLAKELSSKNISLDKEIKEYTRLYSLEEKDYGMRGAFPYFKPCGWVRFALEVPREVFQDDWPIAYHGTKVECVPSILAKGLTGEKAARQAGSLTHKTIYCSPSVEYAAFPTYAAFDKVGNQHWMQIVLQVRVRPGKFVQQPGTMAANKHWPADLRWEPSFDSLYVITHQPKLFAQCSTYLVVC